MATSGSALWDKASVEVVGGLIRVTPSKDLWHLLTSWGLRLWFGQCDPKEFARGIERKAKDVVKLPKPVFEVLSNIAQRPDSFKVHRMRKPEHAAVMGNSCAGYRMEPLFTLPETRAILDTVAERCASRLDSALTSKKKKVGFTEDPLPELGVLLEFTNLGVFQEAARVEKWKKGFDELNALTTDERELWDQYAARVAPSFAMLVAPPVS
jgi:hypothetical protein